MFDKENIVKNFKENRAIYIAAITILLSMILIIAAVSATNRNKQTTPEVTTPKITTSKLPIITTENPSSNVGSKLPDFSLPVSGKLSAVHDSELQVFSQTMCRHEVITTL